MPQATDIQLLLIEDNPGDARLIREMLLGNPNQRVRVQHASTLRDGLALLTEHAFDIVLLDLSLPDSHGEETLTKVVEANQPVAVVVLTGNNDEELGLRAVKMGAQDYLPKTDVDARLLMRSLRYAIERYRIEATVRESEREYSSLINDVFNTSMVAVLILDRQYNVVWCNAATEIYFGIPRERLLGRDSRLLIDTELKCVFADPDDYSQRLLDAYSSGAFTDRFECHVTPDLTREERWLEHWSQPIRDGMYEGGRIEQYTDITDRKMLEIAEEEQRKFAEALRDTAALLSSTLDLDEVLGRMLNKLKRLIPHGSASVVMAEANGLWVAQQRNDPARDTQEMEAAHQLQLEPSAHLDQMRLTGQAVLVDDLQTEPDPDTREAARRANIRSYLGAPIRLQNETIGYLNVFDTRAGFFTTEDSGRLAAVAKLAAIAIQNARLYQQSQELAAVEERQRLARDLHDSVSQTLFTCRTMAETALRRWDKDPARARELTQEVYDLTVTALAEMRILLLELRPAALTNISLKQLFEQYLKPIQDRRRFTLHMSVAEIAPLPPDVQIALYRIVQEALNNIDKHAHARQVEVLADDHADRVEVAISDDGTGFDPTGVAATSLGLGIMRERAESIGATLTIESAIGHGTRITVVWRKS